MGDLSVEHPGSVPEEGETIIPHDLGLIEECEAELAEDIKTIDGRFGKSVLSCSEKWGVIWRVDVYARGSVHLRVTMWRPLGETNGFGRYFDFQQPITPFE